MSRFCLYKETILAYAQGGSFASDAYIKGGMKAMNDIIGTKFLAITADDGKEYNIGKFNVSPITDELVNELLPKAHPAFRIIVTLDQLKTKDMKSYFRWSETKSMNGIPYLLEHGYSEEEIIDYFKNEYFAV